MAENKKTFVAYCEWLQLFEELDDIEAGKLAKHLFRYVNDLNPETDNRSVKLCFIPIKQALKRDLEKYSNVVERNKLNGKKGGRPKKPKKPSGLSGNLEKPKKADNDNDNDNDNDILKARAKKFGESLEPFKTKDNVSEIHKFWYYWTEPNKSKTKLKFEMERTWDTERRLNTWFRNASNFKK